MTQADYKANGQTLTLEEVGEMLAKGKDRFPKWRKINGSTDPEADQLLEQLTKCNVPLSLSVHDGDSPIGVVALVDGTLYELRLPIAITERIAETMHDAIIHARRIRTDQLIDLHQFAEWNAMLAAYGHCYDVAGDAAAAMTLFEDSYRKAIQLKSSIDPDVTGKLLEQLDAIAERVRSECVEAEKAKMATDSTDSASPAGTVSG